MTSTRRGCKAQICAVEIKAVKRYKDWIVGKLDVYRSTDGHNNFLELRSGSSMQILCKYMRIIKVKSDRNAVEQDEKKIFVYLKDDKDETSLSRSFGAW